MIAVVLRVPSKTKAQMEEVQVACQGVEGKYRGACQDAVYILASLVYKQHQFGTTHIFGAQPDHFLEICTFSERLGKFTKLGFASF